MVDYNTVTRDVIPFDNPVYADEWATGDTYEPTDRGQYRHDTAFSLETQLIDSAVNKFYEYYEEKCVKPGQPIGYNDFELIDGKLRVKGSSIDLINKKTH